MPRSLSLQAPANLQLITTQHRLIFQLAGYALEVVLLHPVFPMIGAYVPLVHSSNQVTWSLTHTWHLQASLTSTHRLSESVSLAQSMLLQLLETHLMSFLPFSTCISWRNPYLDSIMRLLPTIEVSVQQNVHPDLPPNCKVHNSIAVYAAMVSLLYSLWVTEAL